MNRFALWVVVLVGACGARTPASVCKGNLLAGDLVITEIMVNPSGDDTGKEWFEVYNNTARDIDATGLELVASVQDGSSAKTHAVTAATIQAGAYFVFGGVANDLRPAYMNYGYANDLGALRNDAGKIALRCNDVVIDEAIYRGPADGASRGFTGALPPDPVANDDTAKWCDATIPYDGTNLGSPGAANESCGAIPGNSTCDENGQTRDIVFPQVGDVVISEIMPNPNKVADTDGEWFELTVVNDVDLNGLEIGATPGTPKLVIVDSTCRHRSAGSRVVFANNSDSAMNGGLPPVEAVFNFGLSNSGGSLYVGVQGTVLDQISWTRSADGASTSLDPGHINPTANDDEAVWCSSTTAYGDGDRGTPGEENDECSVALPQGQCIDGDAVRDAVPPVAGDLVITEILPNPKGADDGKEWFEVYVKRDVDLNGLQLGTTAPTVLKTFTSPNCLRVTTGSYLIFANNDGSVPDGGLPRVDFRFSFTLVNSARGVFLGFGDQLLDAITYGAPSEGVARSLDPDAFDPAANDADSAFCDAANLYGDATNFGTPGSPNPKCPASGDHCIDANGDVRPVVFAGLGDLVISEIMSNPSKVGDDEGEWFEVTVLRDIDANGIEMGTVPGTPRNIVADAACRPRPAGSRLVFAHSADPTLNGGLPAPEATFGFTLGNTSGTLYVGANGTIIDQFSWTHSSDGAATALDPGKIDAVTNDDEASWCDATQTYGDGDHGTPGGPNDACPVVLPAGKCMDGATVRDIVKPVRGDLVITEVLPNPAGADTGKEWFEVLAKRDVDLVDLEIGATYPTVLKTFTGPSCLHVTAGSYLVFAHNDGTVPDGGLPRIDFPFAFDLVNSNRGVFVGIDGALLDDIFYTTVTEGAASSLDPDSLDPTQNDDPTAFCDAQAPYGDQTNKGTPGLPNPQCPTVVLPGQCLDQGVLRDVVRPQAGDLVISEVMADPAAVADASGEFFEVTVLRTVDLNDLELGTTPGVPLVTVSDAACRRRAAGTRVVFGRTADPATNGGLPPVEGTFTFSLANGGGQLYVGVTGTVLDTMTWTTMTSGASRSLDPGAIDPTQNDDLAKWCNATSTFGAGDRGTPGADNDPCPIVVPAGKCLDGQTLRDIVVPVVGDLVITEIMPDPNAAPDTSGEWFEVKLNHDIDLNGLEIGTTPGTPQTTINDVNCRRRTAGSRLVFAKSTSQNGGLPVVEATFGFSLSNSGGTLYVGVGGGTLDATSWTGATAGASHSLDPTKETVVQNDDPAAFCDATSVYGDGDRGTPGAENDPCPIVIPAGKCLDGQTVRDVVRPAVGDLVITEVMPDPNAVADLTGEWFEVSVTRDVDLNDLEIGTVTGTPQVTLVDSNCRRRTAGTRLVFAKSSDPGANGQLPTVEATFGFGLTNSNSSLYIGVNGTPLDTVTWTTVGSGKARNLDPGHIDPTQNDDLANWCDATIAYGAGAPPDLGTPAAANSPCAIVIPAGMCLDGQTVRPIVSPALGDVVISEIMPDPSAVGDTTGEWFELTIAKDVDLNGLEIGTIAGTPLKTITGTNCRRRTNGTRVVFGKTGDNGGLPALEDTFSFSLANSNSSLFVGVNGTALDTVTWTTVTPGSSRSLDPGHTDPGQNDTLLFWCDATGVYGAGDHGTPGAPNDACPPAVPPGMCQDGPIIRPIVSPALGDVVISEVMPDPNAVGDATGEWFELTITKDVDLNGLEIGTIAGTPLKTITDTNCRRRTNGTRVVFGKTGDNGGLPALEDTFSFSLANSNSSLYVGVNGTPLDTVTWTTVTPGASRSLDPGHIDPGQNDTLIFWCDATTVYGAGDHGTPGAPNDACPVVVPAGQCLDNGVLRDVVFPVAGDLVISELMPDPFAVADAAGEWFEVTLRNHDIDLNGVEIGTTPGVPLVTLGGNNCRRRTAGTRLVFGHTGTANGGLPALEDTFPFSLANSTGMLYVGYGGQSLDTVTWSAPAAGKSRSLDPAHIDNGENDDLNRWCDSVTAYGDGDDGTPGAPNDPCPVVVPAGKCLDGEVLRDTVPPVAGDLVITEVMPNPVLVTDAAGEWFEVTVKNHDVDLNGVEIGTTPGTPQLTLGGNACRRRTIGTHVVFGHSDTANGGLPPLEATFGFTLADDGTLFVGFGGGVLDQVTWAAASPGASRSLDPGSTDPTANDTLANWCDADSTYGLGDKGTPGAANDICLPAGECIDGDVARPIVSPVIGDLVITEFLANPHLTDDGKEWFEVLVNNDVDLNGLQIGTDFVTVPLVVRGTYNARACLHATAGTRLVFNHNDAMTPLPNGGLPHVDFLFNFDLVNSNSTAGKGLYVAVAGGILDSTPYTAAQPDGASKVLKTMFTSVTGNDLPANFCTSTVAYGADGENKGTPGTADINCP
jgi:hypothetical protein